MNNAITENKNTMEGTKSRVTEAEEWISEVTYRVVEITEAEHNREKKNIKLWGQSQRPLG